jgi:uncharacterized protein YndB with AHSA1/START domain
VSPITASVEPIRISHRLPVPPEDAFATFTDRIAAWWPHDATWSGEALESIGIEPRIGGFCFERGPHGLRLDWGRVMAWEPPHRLAFSWQIGSDRTPAPNPAHASEVEVRFEPESAATTRVTLEHRGFERHAGDPAAYRDAMASASGWPLILERFRAAVVRRIEAPWEGLTT